MNAAVSRHTQWRPGALCTLIALGLFGIACNNPKREAPATAAGEGEKTRDKGGSAVDLKPTEEPAQELSRPHATATASGIPYGGGYAFNAPSTAKAPAPPAPGLQALRGDTDDERGRIARQVQRLDPNARYATTYRPGGAALAAFDSALARGSLPAVYRDLVGDFSARYAPAMNAPENGALTIQVDTERGSIAPAGGPMHLRIGLRSSAAMPSRARLSVHLVLDVSGSMNGAAMENAKSAAASLVEKLDPQDDFSLVTFSNEANVLIPDGVIGPRRGFVVQKIKQVVADGGTNISAGLDLGYQQAHSKAIPEDAVKIVMLLSDGHANAGDTNPRSLAQRSASAFQDGIQTSSFGLGADFDAPLMSSIADRGAGGYYYLADSTQIASALSKELDARLVPSAQAVEVRVRLRPDIVPTKVYGSRQLSEAEALQVRQQEVSADNNAFKKDHIAKDRQDDAAGGMRFFMPAFARDDRHAMLLSLQIPAGTGDKALGSVEIRYKDRILKKNVTTEIPIKVTYASSDAESAKTIHASVLRTVQAFSAGDAILEAVERVERGDRHGAAQVLAERAELLKRSSTMFNEPLFSEDAARLARLSGAVNSVNDPLPLAVLLRGSGYGYLR
jgi:Ca-activated chloride channel family protein